MKLSLYDTVNPSLYGFISRNALALPISFNSFEKPNDNPLHLHAVCVSTSLTWRGLSLAVQESLPIIYLFCGVQTNQFWNKAVPPRNIFSTEESDNSLQFLEKYRQAISCCHRSKTSIIRSLLLRLGYFTKASVASILLIVP